MPKLSEGHRFRKHVRSGRLGFFSYRKNKKSGVNAKNADMYGTIERCSVDSKDGSPVTRVTVCEKSS